MLQLLYVTIFTQHEYAPSTHHAPCLKQCLNQGVRACVLPLRLNTATRPAKCLYS
eukprot:m.305115 g.305115  ORF g.305115 m.305115 type:complete len:55 (+) comp15905_c1_seq1:599-763(+)